MTSPVSSRDIAKFRRLVRSYASGRLRSFPWRVRTTPYRVLVSELMLQRTGAVQVSRVYEKFVRRFPNLSRVAAARSQTLARTLLPLGRTGRARDIARAFEYLMDNHAGHIPRRLDQLLRVPAVGPYTARAVLCFAYGRRVGLLDPGIYRVLHRVFGIDSAKTRFHADRELWEFVDRLAPRQGVREFNWALLDIAAAICTKREPKCGICPLVSICQFARGRLSVAA